MQNFIRAAAFTGYIDLVQELGANPLSLLGKTNISVKQLENPDNLISSTAFVTALQLAAEHTGSSDFGLRLSECQDINIVGPVGMLARQCETLEESLKVISRHVNLHNPNACIAFETYNGNALLTYDDVTPALPRNPQLCDLSLGIGTSLIRDFTGSTWKPKAVFFIHQEPADTSTYKRVFNAPLFFDQEIYGIEFDKNTLNTKPKLHDPSLKQFLSKYINEIDNNNGNSTVFIIEKLIRSLLSTGRCSEQVIANILQINRRTIQRQLKVENTSFKTLLANIRIRLAKQYLSDSNMSLTSLSDELGYSETSAFLRFFKKQMGVTALHYRKDHSQVFKTDPTLPHRL